jgi:N-acetylglucosaminyldiphosphoundecaprenol N-acetyl-beta-D-mannosaminyltransferase
MLEAPKEFSVLGLPVHLSDSEGYAVWLGSRLWRNQGTHVVMLDSAMVIQAEQNEGLARAIKKAELVIPGGAGVMLYLWMRGWRQRGFPGETDLVECALQQAGQLGKLCPVFFYGGAPQIAPKAAEICQSKYPGLEIAGIWHDYLSPEAQQELQETLKQQQPRLILVGLGVPRQELWIARHRHLCPNAVWIGAGRSFDFWTAVRARSPLWIREWGLEWLYRYRL